MTSAEQTSTATLSIAVSINTFLILARPCALPWATTPQALATWGLMSDSLEDDCSKTFCFYTKAPSSPNPCACLNLAEAASGKEKKYHVR